METEVDNTRAVYERLVRGRERVRNIARFWLSTWLESGVAPSRSDVAAWANYSLEKIGKPLKYLVAAGLIRPRNKSKSIQWSSARLADDVDGPKILALLGEFEDWRRPVLRKIPGKTKAQKEYPLCPECHRPICVDTQDAGGQRCRFCVLLDADPQRRARLDYLRSRAERGIPLFSDPPPYLTVEDAEARIARKRGTAKRTFIEVLQGRR